MSRKPSNDLVVFLKPFPNQVKEIALKIREFIWDFYPESNELIYDNYNALAIGFSLSDKAGDTFCSIAVYANYVNFGFNRGSEISDPEQLLLGDGSLYRRIKVDDLKDLKNKYVKQLILEAYLNALSRFKEDEQIIKGQIITKSISEKKRRP